MPEPTPSGLAIIPLSAMFSAAAAGLAVAREDPAPERLALLAAFLVLQAVGRQASLLGLILILPLGAVPFAVAAGLAVAPRGLGFAGLRHGALILLGVLTVGPRLPDDALLAALAVGCWWAGVAIAGHPIRRQRSTGGIPMILMAAPAAIVLPAVLLSGTVLAACLAFLLWSGGWLVYLYGRAPDLGRAWVALSAGAALADVMIAASAGSALAAFVGLVAFGQGLKPTGT